MRCNVLAIFNAAKTDAPCFGIFICTKFDMNGFVKLSRFKIVYFLLIRTLYMGVIVCVVWLRIPHLIF
jgi:hypothetical protein